MFISFSTIFAVIVVLIFVAIVYLGKSGTFLKKELKNYYYEALKILKPYMSCNFAKILKKLVLSNLKSHASDYKFYTKENRKPTNDYGSIQYIYDLFNHSNNDDIIICWCYLFIERFTPSSYGYNEEEIYKSFKQNIQSKTNEYLKINNIPKSFLYQFGKIKLN